MSRQYVIETFAQPSIYDPNPRKMNVYLSLPEIDQGESLEGIVLLLAGFGGHSQSKVFIKMRNRFSDEYGFAAVQCDYFGWEYMQSERKKETPAHFCDMGPVQAMDNLIALKIVNDFLDENEIAYDSNNVLAYGFSHGAYLAYLMNAFMPRVLSCIIDNSAWLYPEWIRTNRLLFIGGNCTEFHYLISHIIMDPQIYDIEYLYKKLENKCRIFSFHGMHDESIAPIASKIFFSSRIPNMSIELIGEERVDHNMFHSSGHGLDADFLVLFSYVMEKYRTRAQEQRLVFDDNDLSTDNADYHIRDEDGIPILYYNLKKEYDFEGLKLFG